MNDRLDASELPTGWAVRLRRYGCDIDMLKTVVAGLYDAGKVRPQRQDVFRAFQATPLDEVRVVILDKTPTRARMKPTGSHFRYRMRYLRRDR